MEGEGGAGVGMGQGLGCPGDKIPAPPGTPSSSWDPKFLQGPPILPGTPNSSRDPQLLQRPPIPPGSSPPPGSHLLWSSHLPQDPTSPRIPIPLEPPSCHSQSHWNPPFSFRTPIPLESPSCHSQSPALLPQLCARQNHHHPHSQPFLFPFLSQGLNPSEVWSIPVSPILMFQGQE